MPTTRLAPLLLLALAAGCPGPTAPGAAPMGVAPADHVLRLTFDPVRVGDRYQRHDQSLLDMRLPTDDGGTMRDVRDATIDADLEVMAVQDGYPTKVKVTHRQRIARTIDGQAVPAPTPLDGVTALVWRGADGVDASALDGSPLPDDVRAALRKEHVRLGLPDTMDVIMPRHAWQTGEAVPLSAAELTELDATRGAPSEPTITSMIFTLREVRDGLAMFDVTQRATMVDGALQLDVDSVGVVGISVRSGRAETLEISGTMRGTADGRPLTADAQKHATYSPRPMR